MNGVYHKVRKERIGSLLQQRAYLRTSCSRKREYYVYYGTKSK